MKKVRMIVEMDEELYKAFTEQDIFISGMRSGKTLLSEIWKALKNATPLTESDDAVSRKAVNTLVDELARAISDERCCVSRGRSTATIMQDILDLPAVIPKREKGEWEVRYDRWFGTSRYKCLNCGELEDTKSDFCPNCGAEMR